MCFDSARDLVCEYGKPATCSHHAICTLSHPTARVLPVKPNSRRRGVENTL
jgi:hypothetical protein